MPLTRHDVYIADECFLTGTAAEVIPVVKIDSRTIGDGKPGPITRDLIDAVPQAYARISIYAASIGRLRSKAFEMAVRARRHILVAIQWTVVTGQSEFCNASITNEIIDTYCHYLTVQHRFILQTCSC